MRNFSLFFVVIVLFISANAQQSGNGTIHGKVVDVQGALVRGATVNITNASGAERTAQSNQDGEFSFNNLTPEIFFGGDGERLCSVRECGDRHRGG